MYVEICVVNIRIAYGSINLICILCTRCIKLAICMDVMSICYILENNEQISIVFCSNECLNHESFDIGSYMPNVTIHIRVYRFFDFIAQTLVVVIKYPSRLA